LRLQSISLIQNDYSDFSTGDYLARGEQKTLIGYDEDDYAQKSNANERSVENLLKEFKIVRQSSHVLFENFTPEMMHSAGICHETKMTPLALGFVIIGHAEHHLSILKERYFNT
jgi:hypothetical protein